MNNMKQFLRERLGWLRKRTEQTEDHLILFRATADINDETQALTLLGD